MDLSTLTKLSREQLNTFARRAGIKDPERSSATELVATLLNQRVHDAERTLRQGAGKNAAQQVARGVLSALSGSSLLRRFARPEALPESTPIAPIAPSPIAPTPSPLATPATTTETPPIAEAIPSIAAATPVVIVAPEVVEDRSIEDSAASAEPEVPLAPALPVDDGIPTRRFIEEPIRTRSMARVLVSQGHRDRAVSILESIVRDNPEDVAARDDLERLRTDVPLDADLVRLPEPRALPTLPDTGDSIQLRTLPGRALHVSWTATEAGVARAQAVLGTAGELALRVVAITPDPTRVVRSDITERGPVDYINEWTAPAVEPGSRCFAAIGMRAGGRFVAIAHAPARTID